MGFSADPVDPSASPRHLLGAALRHWRADVRKLGLAGVAQQAWVDPSNLGKWERGTRMPPSDAISRIDGVLGANGFLVALHDLVVNLDQISRGANETDRGHAEDMDIVRRQILTSLAALGTSAALPLDTLRHLIDPAGSARVRDWEEIVHEHAHAFHTRPLAELTKDLALDFLDLQHVMQDRTSIATTGAAWQRIKAQLAIMLAHALGSAGEVRASRDWWLTARHAAEAGGDAELEAFARAKAAIQGLYEQRPFPVLLKRADEAIGAADGRPCAGVAVALAVHAQIRAMHGDAAGARDALARQEHVFDRLPEEVTADKLSVFGWPRERLLHTQSFAASYGSGLSSAAQAQREALDAYPATSVRERAQIHLHAALTEVRAGDVLTGLDMARDAITGLPGHHHTTFIRYNARAVLTATPASLPDRARSAVLDYRELLAAPAPPGA